MVISTALAAACSSTPHTAAPPVGGAAQPKQQTLAVTNAPATATATTTTTTTIPTTPSKAVDLSLVNAGYSVQRRHDQIYYCRSEIITGNRIGTRVCLTAAQIQIEKQGVTKTEDNLNQPSIRCLGASCSN
ncbi:MAG TPA: hypothetical protein VHS76_03480 [Steroidobacteraceae bacterium]|nr:hypothetical protein [Steroidobacteraceae bacterium]